MTVYILRISLNIPTKAFCPAMGILCSESFFYTFNLIKRVGYYYCNHIVIPNSEQDPRGMADPSPPPISRVK